MERTITCDWEENSMAGRIYTYVDSKTEKYLWSSSRDNDNPPLVGETVADSQGNRYTIEWGKITVLSGALEAKGADWSTLAVGVAPKKTVSSVPDTGAGTGKQAEADDILVSLIRYKHYRTGEILWETPLQSPLPASKTCMDLGYEWDRVGNPTTRYRVMWTAVSGAASGNVRTVGVMSHSEISDASPAFEKDGGEESLNALARLCYRRSVEAGWLETEEQKAVPTILCLIHSEISEALEGYRCDLMDTHLPHRKMIEVELADAVIRIAMLAGKQNLDLDGAVREKLAYNLTRADHQKEAREKEGGKKF